MTFTSKKKLKNRVTQKSATKNHSYQATNLSKNIIVIYEFEGLEVKFTTK